MIKRRDSEIKVASGQDRQQTMGKPQVTERAGNRFRYPFQALTENWGGRYPAADGSK